MSDALFYRFVEHDTYRYGKLLEAKLESLQAQHAKQLMADGNLALVHQCHTQLVTNQVQHLSRMYSVASVSGTKAAKLYRYVPVCTCLGPARPTFPHVLHTGTLKLGEAYRYIHR
jgi:hypothetical protein